MACYVTWHCCTVAGGPSETLVAANRIKGVKGRKDGWSVGSKTSRPMPAKYLSRGSCDVRAAHLSLRFLLCTYHLLQSLYTPSLKGACERVAFYKAIVLTDRSFDCSPHPHLTGRTVLFPDLSRVTSTEAHRFLKGLSLTVYITIKCSLGTHWLPLKLHFLLDEGFSWGICTCSSTVDCMRFHQKGRPFLQKLFSAVGW